MRYLLIILILVLVDPARAQTTMSGTYPPSLAEDTQAGTSFSIPSTDWGKLIIRTSPTAQTDSIAQATGLFAAGWFAHICAQQAQDIITPTTSLINGQPTLALGQGICATLISDGTNYQAVTVTMQPTVTATVVAIPSLSPPSLTVPKVNPLYAAAGIKSPRAQLSPYFKQ